VKITVKPVQTKKEMMTFITFPWTIYKKDPNWVPPLISDRKSFLNPEKNPFFNHAIVQLFIAYREKKPVGTISAHIIYDHNKIHNDSTGFFGFFEAIDDQLVAHALFETASSWLKCRGMTIMRGPMNFSIHDTCGLLVDGFDSSPCIMMTYNPRYYENLIDSFGFVKEADLYALVMDLKEKPGEHVRQIARDVRADHPNIRIRKINMDNYYEEATFIKEQYDGAMVKNWGYLPFSDDVFMYTAKAMKPFIDPDLIVFAEIDNKIIGYSMSIPDYNFILKKLNGRLFPFGIFKLLFFRKKISYGRMVALGVLPEFRDKRAAVLIYEDAWMNHIHAGYKRFEGGWTHEKNPFLSTTTWLGAKIHKTYRVYDYHIN